MNETNLGKIPPQALELEEAVLGSMLIDSDTIGTIDTVLEILTTDCFYSNENRIIFEAIIAVYKRNSNVDILTVNEQLKASNQLSEIGGTLKLTQLTGRVASSAHAEFHARLIKQKYIQRELIRLGIELENKCFEDNIDLDDIILDHEKSFETINNAMDENPTETLENISNQTLEIIKHRIDCCREQRLTGITTGSHDLNKMTNGWKKDLIIIAARPSIGKSSLIYNNIFRLCEEIFYKQSNEEILLYSLETSKTAVNQKLILSDVSISANDFYKGNIKDSDFIEIEKRILKINKYNLTIIDNIYELHKLIQKTRILKKKFKKDGKKIKAIFIDYLQLMRVAGFNSGNKNNEIGEITRNLALLKKEIECPIILLSQLNREVDKRGGSRMPRLSDLRDSGNIEQDADVVVLLHRPGKDDPEEPQDVIQMIIAKQREGSLGIVSMNHNESLTKFTDFGDAFIANYNNKMSANKEVEVEF
jgi:replicative DNA helicase